MPAHHGIADLVGVHFAALLQKAPFKSVRKLSNWGYLFEEFKTTPKGREILFDGDTDRTKVTGADGRRMLKQMRIKREHRFAGYNEYREYLDALNPRTPSGRKVWEEARGHLADVIRKLDSGSQYDEKGHEGFKEEWDLFLKPGTPFDQIIQLFADRWQIIGITHQYGSSRLKRLEGKKPRKSTHILWTDH
jgi:hypothetical protein